MKITIPKIAKNINQSIIEPLTDQEKEDNYEVCVHINSFTLQDTLTEEVKTLQVVVVPSTKQQIELTQQEEEAEQTNEETHLYNLPPEYVMTKENIHQLAIKISKS